MLMPRQRRAQSPSPAKHKEAEESLRDYVKMEPKAGGMWGRQLV